MSKFLLWAVGFLSLAIATALGVLIMHNNGGFWAIAPGIIWFVIMQVYVVPRILK